jgi:hypothetical protein
MKNSQAMITTRFTGGVLGQAGSTRVVVLLATAYTSFLFRMFIADSA